MYHRIGEGLIKNTKYGNSFIDTLAKDLKLAFPDMQGLSARNLRYMKKFAKEMNIIQFCNIMLQNCRARL